MISAIKYYQKKLGIEWKDDFGVDDAPVWKCLLKGGVKGIYARLVKNSNRPKCLLKGGVQGIYACLVKNSDRPKCLLKGGVKGISACLVKNSNRSKCLDRWRTKYKGRR